MSFWDWIGNVPNGPGGVSMNNVMSWTGTGQRAQLNVTENVGGVAAGVGSVSRYASVTGQGGGTFNTSGLPGGPGADAAANPILEWFKNLPEAQKVAVKQKLYWGGFYGSKQPVAAASALPLPDDIAALKSAGDGFYSGTLNTSTQSLDNYLNELASQGQKQGAPLGSDMAQLAADRRKSLTAEAVRKAELAQAVEQRRVANLTRVQDGIKAETDLRDYAAAQGLDFDDQWYAKHATDIAMQQTTPDHVKRQVLNDYVLSAFPAWQKQLESGLTVSQLAGPYMQAMSSILELPAEQLGVRDPTIRKAMQGVGADGTPSVKPLWQFESELRNDPRWDTTKDAIQTGDQLAAGLRETFGFGGVRANNG